MLKSLIVLLLVKCTEKDIAPMNLCGNNVEWCKSIKYLGVYLQSGKCVKFNINATKRAFYAACNSIFMHSSGITNDMTLLHLQETYSLSVLLYAIPALLLTIRQVSELNACWNNVICSLVITNGRVLVHCYCRWKDLMLNISLCFVRFIFISVYCLPLIFLSIICFSLFCIITETMVFYSNLCFYHKSDAIHSVWTAFQDYVLC